MTLPATSPSWLNRFDCADITFVLNLVEDVELPPLALLQLRREFVGALPELEIRQGSEAVQAVKGLIFPEPLADPLLQRQVQRPSAAVVLSPESSVPGPLVKGGQLVVPALFIGDGVVGISAFMQLLRIVGERGMYRGRGRFVIDSLLLNPGSGEKIRIEATSSAVTPTIVPLGWLLTRRQHQEKVKLEVLTPMRLIKKGKPIFRLSFNDFFVFLLRRVGSMAAVHAGGHFDSEYQQLLELAREVECLNYSLQWRDWRHLERGPNSQGIGGLTGTMTLSGDFLSDLLWLLELGSLLHVGKGASYGFGRYRLVDVVDRPVEFS